MPRGDTEARIHCFNDLEVDEGVRQIRHRGSVVAVEPKPFDLLVFLLRQRHRVVSRDELMQAIWPDVVVSEATLSSAVRRAREAIAPHRELIQGVRKVGYRFIGEIHGTIDERRDPIGPQASADIRVGLAGPLVPHATPYVGRPRELAELEAELARGLSGEAAFLVISGEPGIGKTRTIDELLRRAPAATAEILVGRCYEGEGGQAFWPWVQVFRAFAAHRDAAELADVLGAEASDLARLTAAVAAPPEEMPWADPEVLRARLFDAAVTVLRRAAQRTPLLVVLDDLHWADTASLTLLLVVARQLVDVPLMVIGAYRDHEVSAEHPLSALLATLRREQRMRCVALRGLERAEASLLLQTSAGAPVEEGTTTAVFEATEGNPFFALEYWRDLEEAGAVTRREQRWERRDDSISLAVPVTIAETIDRRLRRLSPECLRLLTIGAVMGRELTYELLSEVSTTAPAQTIELLDTAAAARVIEEVSGEPGSYRFAHALIRQTLYERMTALRRAALHRYVGEAIEKRAPASASRTVVADLAHHFLLAAPAGGARQAILYAERAAAEATQACAYDEAVGYLERAVELADGSTRSGDAEDLRRQCRLRVALAEALSRAGDGVRMRACFERAAELARSLPAPTLLARTAIGLTRNPALEDEYAVALCDEALSLLPPAETALRAQVQASLAKVLYLFDGTRERRRQLCAEARAAAAESGDPRLLGQVLADCLEAEFNCDGLAEQDELCASLCEVAEATGEARLRLLGRAWQIVNLMRRGRLNQADRCLADFSQLAGELRQPRFLYHAAAFDAALLLARGRLAQAEARSEEALRLGTPIDAAAAGWLHWAQLSHLRREQGRFAEFIDSGLALRLPPGTPAGRAYQRSYRWAAPHLFSELGREAEAKASFEALIADGFDALPAENARNSRIPALFSLADTCATIGNTEAATQLYALAEPYADQWHVLGWGSVVFASTHLMLGVLQGVRQRWDEAIAHFEEALRQHREQGALCGEARTLYQYARMLQRRGERGDHEQALQMIENGLTICTEHGLRGVEVRLLRLRPTREAG